MVSTMPSTVIGFTNEAAPSTAVAPAGSSRHSATLTDRYCEYIPPPAAATTLPSRACAAADSPAATTVPAPSLPTGRGVPTAGQAAHGGIGDGRGDDRALGRSASHRGPHISPAEQQAHVRRVERCCLNPDEDLIWSRPRQRDHVQEQLKRLIGSHQRSQRERFGRNLCGHR